MNREKTVAIIGGGAAGLMSAVSVKENTPGMRVLLFEKNAYLGAKVSISGGSRCNVTAGIFDVREILKNYPRGARFLSTAMYDFPPEKVMQWFEKHGVPLKVENDLRVFPVSDKGKDVVSALEKYLRAAGVEIICNADVETICKKENVFEIEARAGSVKGTPKKIYKADRVVIASGGNAYRHTGSTGDGYAFAQALSHTITPLAPSLSSFIVSENFARDLAGVSFEKASLSLSSAETSYSRTGPFVFTHKGVSGPAVFALSSLAAYEMFSKEKPLGRATAMMPQHQFACIGDRLSHYCPDARFARSGHPLVLAINFFPDENAEVLKKRVEEVLRKNQKKTLMNILDFFLPKSLCAVIISLLKADSRITGAHVTKEVKNVMLALFRHFPLTVIGRSAGEEFVTAGGVSLKEVNAKTMESKICPGLYFAGEVLDVDGFTGGFNLQASWATGRCAGKSISRGF